ncbi:MAG TPA: 50S ribosomal protein L4, partial [Nitrospiria bacterium]
LIHEAVVMQRAAMRQGTAATKNRAAVRGGGRKPWRQKGTGRARHGSIRSPIWRGGGVAFGPIPRDYGYAFPRKKYRAALKGVLTAKLKDGEILVIDRLGAMDGKTKQMTGMLKSLGLKGKVLIVTAGADENLPRSARNIQGLKLLPPRGLNVYDLIVARHIVLPQDMLQAIQEVWS